MTSKYLKEFERLNRTTESIYELGELEVLIILKNGVNLTNWEDVKNKEDIMYITEDLSNYINLNGKYAGLKSLKAVVALGVSNKVTNMQKNVLAMLVFG